MRAILLLCLVLVASCNKGPSCETQKRDAQSAIQRAKAAASNVTREQADLDAATARLDEVFTFERTMIAGWSKIRSEHSCPEEPEVVCCANAAKWIEAHAKVPEAERPLWRLPAIPASKGFPVELTKDLAAYGEATGKLATLLQKGAPAADVSAACTEVNTAVRALRGTAPGLLKASSTKAKAERDARADALRILTDRGDEIAEWEAALARDAKFEVSPPSPTEPVAITEARAKAKAVQSCLK